MDQDEVVKNLRSCLISCKGGIKLDNLKADYRMIAGESLPYKQFGFPTVEAFVRTIPDIIMTKKNGELYVEAIPSKNTAHLTKLISRQKSTRRKVPKKKWSPLHYAPKGFSPGFKNNNSSNFQYVKSSYDAPSFTRSTPGKSSLYTDFSRPLMPLMETIVQYPFSHNNENPSFGPVTPPISPIRRLKDKVTNIATSNQNGNNCKNIENFKCKVLNDKTAATTVINMKSKTAEPRTSKLSERLKIPSPTNIPQTPSSPTYSNYNNGNNGNVISPSTQSIIDMSKASNPREELEICANMMNLPSPVYRMYSKKDKHSAKVTIYASVKVGVHTFHTFPEDAASEQEAEKMAARLALMNLAKESASPEVTTDDTAVMKERILNIVTRHHSGIFMHLLPEYYNKEYGEALPHNWERIVEGCTEMNQEKGVGNLTIICRTSQTLKRSDSNLPSRDTSEIISLSGEKIQLSPIGPAAPDKLTVPEATVWQVCVTHVVSTKEVWVRLGDENDNFVDMMNDMKKHYSQEKESASTSVGCFVGHFYTVQEDDYWHRVQCIESDSETGFVTVFFIDEGYEEQYKSNLLHPLEKKFCILPAQAIRVALQELEVFQDYAQATTEIENYLVSDRMFLVTVHSTNTDEYGSYTTVTFFDTSKEDADENMNQIIFDKIIDHIIASSKVQAGKLIELYVTHIDKHGKVYAQLDTPARNLLHDEIIMQAFANNMTNSLKGLNFTKTYLVKWNSQLYRARVTDIPSDEVTVFLVDVGKTITMSRKNLLPIENFSKTLQCIPPQATQIYLHNINPSMYDDKLVARFRELVSDTDLLLAKVIKIGSGIPTVEIFKRVGPNNILASINHSVILDSQLTKVNEDSNNNIKAKKRVERRNSRALEPVGKLNPPTISDIGQYFDVHITLAAHPGHFIVQPLSDANELKTMMENLQKCYISYDGPSLETVSEGMLYAGKFNNDWYRVYVTHIISDNEVSVYFCDFGDVTIVQRSSLQPLKSEFLRLPYQAVKAKLVGIEPMNTDWSVGDCVRFKDLVLDKNFVSVVVESVFDHFSPANGTVLGLRLIDVSTEKDIYIDRLLVEEKRAKFIDGFEENLSSSS